VAVSGDTAVVGARQDRVGSNDYQGSAYVFIRTGNNWTQQAQLTAADGATRDFFGHSVAISGDTVVVGAYGADVGANQDQGSAYVFTRGGNGWTQQQELSDSQGAADDRFGTSVAIDGDTVVVGATGHEVFTMGRVGTAYVFTRNGTTWSQQSEFTGWDGAPNDSFGSSVAISGEMAVVGASRHQVGSNAGQGAAYVFARSGSNWSGQVKLTAGDGAENDWFGDSVAISAFLRTTTTRTATTRKSTGSISLRTATSG
jgi:hypothetical protein